MAEKINIVFLQNGLAYYFAKITSTNDGSLEIAFPSMKESSGISQDLRLSPDGDKFEPILLCSTDSPSSTEKKHYISYHTTGRINYHKMSFQPAFMEPLYNIKAENPFFIYSFVSPEEAFMQEDYKERNNTLNVDISELTGKRVNVVFSVCPSDYHPISSNSFSINFPLYSLHIEILEDSSTFQFSRLYKEEDCVKIRPHLDKYNKQVITKEKAFLEYNRAFYKTNEAIVLPPNGEGIIKIIFIVEMRIAPWLFIEFESPNYCAEVVTRKTTHLTFKVFDKKKNQYIKNKEDIIIKNLVLDAEIYDDDSIAPSGCV